MDARRRLFALIVALFCAMGWAPSASASALGEGDRVVSGEGRGVLPGRRPDAPPAEPSIGSDDDAPADLPPRAAALPDATERRVASPSGRVDDDRRVTRRVRPASPRGPPSMR